MRYDKYSPCTKQIHIKISEEHLEMIKEKMKQSGIINMSAYIKKMAIDGYVIKLDLSDVKEVSRLLRINANNINQIAKVANGTGYINPKQIEELQQQMDKLLDSQKMVYEGLCKIIR